MILEPRGEKVKRGVVCNCVEGSSVGMALPGLRLHREGKTSIRAPAGDPHGLPGPGDTSDSHVQTRGEASECLSGRRENSQQDWEISVSMSLCMSIYAYICIYVSIYPYLFINRGETDMSWSTALCWRWDLFTEKLSQCSVSLSVLFVRPFSELLWTGRFALVSTASPAPPSAQHQ